MVVSFIMYIISKPRQNDFWKRMNANALQITQQI